MAFPTLPSAMPRNRCRLAPAPTRSGDAVNVFGFFNGRFGLGEAARLHACALEAAGAEVRRIDLDTTVVHPRFIDAHQRLDSRPHEDGVDLVVANPDVWDAVALQLDSTGRRRPRLGCWFWELAEAPPTWRAAAQHLDGLVVASSHIRRAVSEVLRMPVFVVPLSIEPDEARDRLSRGDFGLPAEPYLFLTAFDFHSSFERKNPLAVMAAFREAFPGPENKVALLIKTSNAAHYPEKLKHLLDGTGGDPRIIVRDGLLDTEHVSDLQASCDAFVSLHRAEGFGLSLAECMARGKPVVATAWSGNLDFMDECTALLIGAPLTDVEGDCPPYTGGRWAEPDVTLAAAAMRRLVADRSFSRSLGARAQRRVATQLSRYRVGRDLLDAVRATRAAATTFSSSP